jgi:hypothetical protein
MCEIKVGMQWKKKKKCGMYGVGDEMKKNGNFTFKVHGISIYLSKLILSSSEVIECISYE